MEFDINSEGTVEHAYVVYSSDMVFDLPAVEAVSQFTFDPRSVPRARPQNQGRRPSGRRGIPEDQRQRSASEDRRPESMRSIKLDPIYELNLTGDYENGSVIVQFDVNSRGHVEGPKIVEVIDTSLSEEIAKRILDEVSFFWYAPWIENDLPKRVYGVRHQIELSFVNE